MTGNLCVVCANLENAEENRGTRELPCPDIVTVITMVTLTAAHRYSAQELILNLCTRHAIRYYAGLPSSS